MACIFDFEVIRPKMEFDQEETLEWLSICHARAEAKRKHWQEGSKEFDEFHHGIKEWLFKLGTGIDKIKRRGLQIPDRHTRSEDDIYNLDKGPEGRGFKERSAFFDQEASQILEQFYPSQANKATSHLIHVTCTGYVAPSAAQKLVAKRGFETKTQVTHCYHMGCYASIPALRMARGFLHNPHSPFPVNIVHTEICSLHMNPLSHDIPNLVIQSLFADGFIKYSIYPKTDTPFLKILTLYEEIIPDSAHCMTWACHDWGMGMFISKDVPFLISKILRPFLERLAISANLSLEQLLENAYFAVHPGGPKILSQVEEQLGLQENQLAHSRQVLHQLGNMSSATLPHIWEKMLRDENVHDGSLIVSLAFGPGLTVCGAIFEKGGS